MSLQLVSSSPPSSDGFEIPKRDLWRMPTRPGVSQTRLSLTIAAILAEAAGDVAREEGLREDAWIGLAVESERALRLLGLDDASGARFRAVLDAAAANPLPPVPGLPVRIRDFAAALRSLRGQQDAEVVRLGVPGQAEVTVSARIPFHSAVAWQRGAIEAGLTLGEWAAEHLRKLPRDRLLWEAAAVEAGETLAEWVLDQAARRPSAR